MTTKVALFLILLMPAVLARADSSLCEKSEITVWSCFAKKKTYSLCASNSINHVSGYMQYRVGKVGNIEFLYPQNLKHPKGIFNSVLGARGGWVSFKNDDYEYALSDQLIGASYISVEKNGRSIAEIQCSAAEPSILDTSTLNLFKSIGLNNQ